MGYLGNLIKLWVLIYVSLRVGNMIGENKCFGIKSNVTLLDERDTAVASIKSLQVELHVYKNGRMNDLVNLLTGENERLKNNLIHCSKIN
jgi:hypothetical protein